VLDGPVRFVRPRAALARARCEKVACLRSAFDDRFRMARGSFLACEIAAGITSAQRRSGDVCATEYQVVAPPRARGAKHFRRSGRKYHSPPMRHTASFSFLHQAVSISSRDWLEQRVSGGAGRGTSLSRCSILSGQQGSGRSFEARIARWAEQAWQDAKVCSHWAATISTPPVCILYYFAPPINVSTKNKGNPAGLRRK